MFSNELNTRDLYFSNPLDRFLGPDHEIKTSFESGFSSTYSGQTENSKELQYKNSEDLFSQRSEVEESQFNASNSDYQKYISQNLLLGKRTKSPNSILTCKQNQDNDKRKEQWNFQHELNENFIKEIRDKLSSLHECTEKINSNVTHYSSIIEDLQKDVSNLQNKLGSTEKSVVKTEELFNESCKDNTKFNKKMEEDRSKIYATVIKNKENIESLMRKFEDHIEQNGRNLNENIQNFTKICESTNEKHLQKIQDTTSKIDNTITKLDELVDVSVKNYHKRLENIFEQKFKDIKGYICNTLTKMHLLLQVNSPNICTLNASSTKKYPFSQRSICNSRNNTYLHNNIESPLVPSYRNTYMDHFNNLMMKNISEKTFPTHPVQTQPLAKYMNSWERISSKKTKKYATQIKGRVAQENECNINTRSKNLKVKRKISTPLLKSITPVKRIMQTTNYCTPLNYFDDFNQSNLTKSLAQFSVPDSRNGYKKELFVSPINSSPGLTVYEATCLAREYAIHAYK